MEKSSNHKSSDFFLDTRVRKRKNRLLKERLRTHIKSKGMSEPEFYNSIGISKQNWYSLSWGLFEANVETRVKIAKALGVDSSVIFWQDDLVDSYWQEIKKEESKNE